MVEFKILVLPGIRGGINIPIALQSSINRYYLRDVYNKESTPICEIAYNTSLPQLRYLIHTAARPTLIVISTRLLIGYESAEAIRELATNHNNELITFAFVMEREESSLKELSHFLDTYCGKNHSEDLFRHE